MEKLNIIDEQKNALFLAKIAKLQNDQQLFLKDLNTRKIEPFKEICKIKIPEYHLEITKTSLNSNVFKNFETGNISLNFFVSDMSRSYSVKQVPFMNGEQIIINGGIVLFTHCSKMFCTAEYLVNHIKEYSKSVNSETKIILGFQKHQETKEIHLFGLIFVDNNPEILAYPLDFIHDNKRNILLC